MHNIQVKRGKEKAVQQHHPWLFSGAIETPKKGIEPGEIVRVHDCNKQFLAYGYFNLASKITVRLLEWKEDVLIDDAWWKGKIKESIERRVGLAASKTTNAYRLVHGEADFLPGLIVDQYGDYLSMQLLTAGVEKQKQVIINSLQEILSPKGIMERSDTDSRKIEGLDPFAGIVAGKVPEEIKIKENGIAFSVSLHAGQKSGYYVDQRDNRALLASMVKDKSVLDCFSYTGGFSAYAKAAGAARVLSVDSSAAAIENVKANYALNKLTFEEGDIIEADCFEFLRQCTEQFNVVILDPPKLAPTRASVERAQRAYKDINRLGMKAVSPGGLLATFSCSAGMDIALFKQIIAWAALDAGREIQIIHQFCQPADHPVRASFPESEYLKGLLCRVL